MKSLCSIPASDLIDQYKSLGTDISRLIGETETFELIEYDNGLMAWTPPITGDSQFYDDLATSNPWYYLPDKEEYEVATRYIDSHSVLEVGCGQGYFASRYNLPSYVGLELNEMAVKKAQDQGLNVLLQDFHSYAIRHLGSVSCVCSFQVLEHLDSPDAFFQSAHKVLSKDGIVITAVPSENSFVGAVKCGGLNAPPHHITRWTDECLRKFPEPYGFQCLDIVHIPVEQIHAQWFWSTLIDKVFSSQAKPITLKEKVKRKLLRRLLNSLGVTNVVPKELFIPGHTVVAVHKKVAF